MPSGPVWTGAPSQTLAVPGGVVLSSQEGWAAYQECIDQLQLLEPLPPFTYSVALTLAAMTGV